MPILPLIVPSTAEIIKKGRISSVDFIFSNLEFSEDVSKIVSEKLSIPQTAESSNVPKEESERFCEFANYSALKKLHCFIEIIKNRINLIMDETPKAQEVKDLYKDFSFGFLDSARESSTKETPLSKQISHSHATKRKFYDKVSKSNSKSKFNTRKKSLNELEILRKLSVFPQFFVKMYSAEVDGNVISYEFEKLLPLVHYCNSRLSPIIQCPHPLDSMFACIKFSVDCLMGLHLLHDHMRLVHSDISINNIMYDIEGDCWKIIDFDQTMEIDESLSNSRKAGTRLNQKKLEFFQSNPTFIHLEKSL